MSRIFSDVEPAWAWIILGLVVAACEMLAPGAFLIWIGIAGVLTGVVVALIAVSWEAQCLVFAAWAVVAVLVGRRVAGRPPSNLNQRGYSLIGSDFVLVEPIVGGAGRLKRGDTTWRISGPDLPAGSRVRVTGLDGTTLVVAAIG